MKVKYIGLGILEDERGNKYICDEDGYGSIYSLLTGELYRITNRDKNGNPIGIMPM